MSCRDCVFKSIYQDMGASFDVCRMQDKLPDAARACDNSESCQYRLTVQEAKKIVIKGADFLRDRDVVEVVRCKDCKHNPQNGGECDRSITHTGRDYVCEVNTYRYIGIDYCSYGERKEE